MLETVTYWLAVLTLVTLPPAFFYWFLIHPFASRWRKLGAVRTYFLVIGLCVLMGYGLWQVREPLLAVRYGFNPWATAIGAVFYLASAVIDFKARRHLKFHILAGAPELSNKGPGKLLDEGIYSRIRHPRYTALVLGMIGFGLFINYLALYVMLLLSGPVLWLLVLLEERELRQRFGEAYAENSRRVSRFIPRWKKA